MDVTIRGRNVEVSGPLRNAVEHKVSRLARHLDGWDHAEVHFTEERNRRISDKEVCEITLRGHGHVIRAKAASPDAFTSVDRVVDKLEHQIEKLKRRVSRRSSGRRQPAGTVNVVDDVDADEDEDDRGGRIVKVKRFAIKPMTPEEAALQMDMLGHDFYFFTNSESGEPAVVYRRNDGDVGLIDAE